MREGVRHLQLTLGSDRGETVPVGASSFSIRGERSGAAVTGVLRTTDVLLKEIVHLHSFIKVQVEPKVAPGLSAAPWLMSWRVVTEHPERRVTVVTDSAREVKAKMFTTQQLQMMYQLLLVIEADNIKLPTSRVAQTNIPGTESSEQVLHALREGSDEPCIIRWTFVEIVLLANHLEKEAGRFPAGFVVAVAHFRTSQSVHSQVVMGSKWQGDFLIRHHHCHIMMMMMMMTVIMMLDCMTDGHPVR
jgi:hypothetical protein